jgi:periplasmic divalent cation tolerance protein
LCFGTAGTAVVQDNCHNRCRARQSRRFAWFGVLDDNRQLYLCRELPMVVLQIVTTVPRMDDARRIAERLVEQRLAACVQIVGPIESVYRWKDKIETSQEWQCWVKTRGDLYGSVEKTIRELHPYDVPEILSSVAEGSKPYLKWLREATKRD